MADALLSTRICLLLIDLHLVMNHFSKIDPVFNTLERLFPWLVSTFYVNDLQDPKQVIGPFPYGIQKRDIFIRYLYARARFALKAKLLKNAKKDIKRLFGVDLHSNDDVLNENQSKQPVNSFFGSSKEAVLFVRSNLEFIRSNCFNALNILNSIPKSNDPIKNMIILNDLACIYSKVERYHAASLYFSLALRENETFLKSKEASNLSLFSKTRKLQLVYNLANQLLRTGNPELAFSAYHQSLPLFSKQPKIWLRLAECCVFSHTKKLNEKNKSNATCLIRKIHDLGPEKPKVLLLPKGLDQSTLLQENENSVLPSISFGQQCCRNVLYLLSQSGSFEDSEEEQLIYQAALINAAFLCLAANDPSVALSYGRKLLHNEKCTDNNRYLANIYCAEALCMLKRPNEAAQYLSLQNLGLGETSNQNFISSPYSSLSPETSLQVRYTLYINLSIVAILRDELHQAQLYLNQAFSLNRSTPTYLLQIYLELRKGNTELATQLRQANFAVSSKNNE